MKDIAMNFKSKGCAALAAALLVALPAQASLVNLGDGTVLDSATNLVWLYDWNVNGTHERSTQQTWAQNLDFAGASDWRLPNFQELIDVNQNAGGLAGMNDNFAHVDAGLYLTRLLLTGFMVNTVFVDVCGFTVGSGSSNALFVVAVSMTSGSSTCVNSYQMASAVAVRNASVPASTVPEPQTLALSLLALAAAAGVRRRQK